MQFETVEVSGLDDTGQIHMAYVKVKAQWKIAPLLLSWDKLNQTSLFRKQTLSRIQELGMNYVQIV